MALRSSVLLVAIWLRAVSSILAGDDAPPPRLTIPRVAHAPKIDEFLGMQAEDTHGMARIEGFTQSFPEDGKPSSERTVAYLGYDDKNFYAVFLCFDKHPEKIRARMAKRDQIFDDDTVALGLDTFHDARRTYVFFSNPFGIQADGLFAEGLDFDLSFDTLWYSEGRRAEKGYVIWMAIPFKSLRFSSDSRQSWGVGLTRFIPHQSEGSWWPRVTPRKQGIVQQFAALDGLENISPGRNLQFIPYGFFRSFRALETANPPAHFVSDRFHPEIGLDSKAVLKDKLVLDFTVNPDFSQIESDEPQVTVNQRFEVFFPEKRPFFMENSNFFQTPINLLFTRRIADPQHGARVTGKLGPYTIATFLTDDQAPGKSVPATDPLFGKSAFFAVLRVNRDVSKQSTLGLIATARELQGAYNRVLGPDARWKINSNWALDVQAVASETRTTDGQQLAGPAYRLQLSRDGRSFNYNLQYNDISPNFRAEAGFIPRVDLRELNQFIGYNFWEENKRIITWQPRLSL